VSHQAGAALGQATPGGDGRDASADVEEQASAQDADYLFDPETVRTFELRLDEDDLAFLDADPKAEQYVPGELYFEDQRVKPVGIRYKGSNGSFVGCLSNGGFPATGSKSCPKLSMKIKIDYGDPDAKFYGQKKLLFHAMNGDRSLMRERLGYGLFRELGVHASRTTHVRLLINGVFSGLYLLVEEIDGRFTRSRFADGGRGNLYKEAWTTRSSIATRSRPIATKTPASTRYSPSRAPCAARTTRPCPACCRTG
jgi:spore coat protein CotH